jgi:hypothetical protein
MWIYTSTPPYTFMAWCITSEAQGQVYRTFANALNREFVVWARIRGASVEALISFTFDGEYSVLSYSEQV